jgi:hypothetical protein
MWLVMKRQIAALEDWNHPLVSAIRAKVESVMIKGRNRNPIAGDGA